MTLSAPHLPNIILITLDSCRWDSFVAAGMERTALDSEPIRSFAQATFTYAAHLAMFQGILPHSYEQRPFYNRYNRQLIRIARRPADKPAWLTIDAAHLDLVRGLSSLGYRTVGLGAMEWFRHPDLSRHFDYFKHTGIHGVRQTEIALDELRRAKEPLLLFVNYGETHHPYEYSRHRRILPAPFSRARMGSLPRLSDYRWEQQVECCRFLDEMVGLLLNAITETKHPTLALICGDHGECFGEDGQWGHGFYHYKIMEVPMVIHFLNGLSTDSFPEDLADG